MPRSRYKSVNLKFDMSESKVSRNFRYRPSSSDHSSLGIATSFKPYLSSADNGARFASAQGRSNNVATSERPEALPRKNLQVAQRNTSIQSEEASRCALSMTPSIGARRRGDARPMRMH